MVKSVCAFFTGRVSGALSSVGQNAVIMKEMEILKEYGHILICLRICCLPREDDHTLLRKAILKCLSKEALS